MRKKTKLACAGLMHPLKLRLCLDEGVDFRPYLGAFRLQIGRPVLQIADPRGKLLTDLFKAPKKSHQSL